MTANPVLVLTAVPRLETRWRPFLMPRHAAPVAFLPPSLLFLPAFFVFPAVGLMSYSVLTQSAQGRQAHVERPSVPSFREAAAGA